MFRIKKSEVKNGEGKVFSTIGNHGIAVYRDGDQFTVLSTDCPHKHCDIGWAEESKTWLCPCHGAQFDKTGQLLRGPAEKNLSNLEFEDLGEEIEIKN